MPACLIENLNIFGNTEQPFDSEKRPSVYRKIDTLCGWCSQGLKERVALNSKLTDIIHPANSVQFIFAPSRLCGLCDHKKTNAGLLLPAFILPARFALA